MKHIKFNKTILFGVLTLISIFAFAKNEKVIQIYKNGEKIQEYLASEIDFIEINDLVTPPDNIKVSTDNDKISISWNAVDAAVYNIYRSSDNIDFILIASNIKENRYIDANPNPGANYYKIKAIVDNVESDFTTTVSGVLITEPLESGIYLGVTGFNEYLYEFPISRLTYSSIGECNEFIDNLNPGMGTVLYYAVDKSLDKLESVSLPNDVTTVAIVTFTDGLDQGSVMMEGVTHEDNMEYLEALNQRIMNETVSGVPITAYSVGVKGKDVSDTQMFNDNLRKLASSSENVKQVESMSEVNETFKEIANTLTQSSNVQTMQIRMPGASNGSIIRFTFDNVASADKSELYIEGKFNLKNRSLEDVKYVGLTSSSGIEVKGEVSGIWVTFTFEGIHTDNNELITSDYTGEWTYIPSNSLWQINSEFEKDRDFEVEVHKSSAAILLVLDCSGSLAADFVIAQKNAKDFVSTLYNVVGSIPVPVNFKARKTEDGIELSWDEIAGVGYDVYRSANGESYTRIASNIQNTSYTDKNPLAGLNYYKVKAVEEGVYSDYSESAYLIFAPRPENIESVVEGDKVKISWSRITGAQYSVWHSTDNINYNEIASGITNDYFYADASAGLNYYKVKSYIMDEESEYSSPTELYYVSVPTNLTAKVDNGSIILNWDCVDGASYELYRSTDGKNYSLRASISDTQFIDDSKINDNYYKVRAVINNYKSDFSSPFYIYLPYINGHEAVDLGLPSGLKWASMNIGANSITDYGNYYAWGEVSEKLTYTEANSELTHNTGIRFIAGYEGRDAATAKWGSTWRLPSAQEYQELIDYCQWKWTSINGIEGYLVTGSSGNSIFLPAGGFKLESSHQSVGMGYYWTSSYVSDITAMRLNFTSSLHVVVDNLKLAGLTVRAVSE